MLMKIPSRNRAREVKEDEIECPYCHCKWCNPVEEDFYMYLHTKIFYCRECGEEFINGITKDILYKYS